MSLDVSSFGVLTVSVLVVGAGIVYAGQRHGHERSFGWLLVNKRQDRGGLVVTAMC